MVAPKRHQVPSSRIQTPIVDLLIGADQADLLYSLEDVRGKPGEPIARPTPLRWTCIGNPKVPAERTQTNFTFLVNDTHEPSGLRKL